MAPSVLTVVHPVAVILLSQIAVIFNRHTRKQRLTDTFKKSPAIAAAATVKVEGDAAAATIAQFQ
jgi:hypothetical protein